MSEGPERDALVEKYHDYARGLAHKVSRDLPSFISRDEIFSVAIAGLVDAAARFDATRGVQFTTFAYYRIRGAVFDYVRRSANSDPYFRARASGQAAADSLVENALAERPRGTNESPADAAGVLSEVLDSVAVAFTVTECAEALVSEGSHQDPETEAARREGAGRVHDALAKLPERERKLMTAMYFEAATLEEAGAALGLSKSWACRIHARALSLMRESIGGQ